MYAWDFDKGSGVTPPDGGPVDRRHRRADAVALAVVVDGLLARNPTVVVVDDHETTLRHPRFERDERVKMIPTETRPPSRECGSVRRRVSSDGFVEVETNRYPVPYQWCRGQVEVQLTESEVRIVYQGQSVLYERGAEKHRVVRWGGPPRELQRGDRPTATPADPPQFDPAWVESFGRVMSRPLDAYAAVAEEVSR